MTFEEWWDSVSDKVEHHFPDMEFCKAAWLASRKAALEEAALACQKHTPKDFTVAGIITRAKCAEAVLALKERA